MNSFSIGRYVPYNSFVHRLDPRDKILGSILLMVCVFLPISGWAMTFTMSGILFILTMILLWCTHSSIRDILSSLRSMWMMILFLLLIYILMPHSNPILGQAWNWNGWIVYWDSFAEAGKIVLRLLMMVELTMILTASTKPLDLTYAFEWYLTPLKWLHFPAHEVAMTISIALRFIPTLLDDTNRVMKAQESRGVDFAHGRLWKRLTALTSLIIPLFVSAFMRSEELANAMECRGYDPKAKRTRYRLLHWRWFDWISLVVVFAIFALFLYVTIAHFDAYLFFWGLQVV